MKQPNYQQRNFRSVMAGSVILSAIVIVLFSGGPNVIAHDGEDHGESKPAVTTPNGMVSRTARLGDLEVLVKYSLLEPDTPLSGRLFITRFATNEPIGDAVVEAEVESPTGMVTAITIEKTDAVGSYVLKIPALQQGSYALRTSLSIPGKTDTATFSGVHVGLHDKSPLSSARSWTQTAFMTFLLIVGSILLAGLIFLAFWAVKDRPTREDPVAAQI
ncbi:MAG: hypothetical protein LC734_03900 [Acidobacteria bacterium]|nr:hypothetical protein [Acidobacteriota bacterium]